MKRPVITFVALMLSSIGAVAQIHSADSVKKFQPETPYTLSDPERQTVLSSAIDPAWPLWKERSFGYGLNGSKTPMPLVVDAPLQVNSFLQLRTNARYQRRWGYHFLEAYSIYDNKSRFTMLMDKHVEFGRPVAELYYFGNKYNISEEGYNWVRIGSDVLGHSFLFNRDRAVFFGGLTLSNALTLGNIGADNILTEKPSGGNGEENHEQESKFVNYTQLKDAPDGTMFYDKDHHLVVIKVQGEWMRLKVRKLPKGVTYPF